MNCQHCGSASRSDWGYECGSSSSVGFERSIRCRTKEISNIRQELEESNNRIKRLEEENLRLKDRIKRLVKVGDYLDAYVSPVRENRTVKQLWTQAKEAK